MKEEILGIFVKGAARYFQEATREEAQVGAPFLLEPGRPESSLLQHAAIIGITGSQKGSIIFTAGRPLAEELVRRMGETLPDTALCDDMVGEVTNTIAGNAREALGSDFMISTPVMVSGERERVHFSRGVEGYVIPITWQGMRSFLIVGLEATH